jgi:hypothetical protein
MGPWRLEQLRVAAGLRLAKRAGDPQEHVQGAVIEGEAP